jgi:hypothetical protein
VWSGVTELTDSGPARSLLYGEVVAVWAFSASWLWKGLELKSLFGGWLVSPDSPRKELLARAIA